MPQKFIDQTTIQPDGKPGDDAFTAFATCNDNFQDAEARLASLEDGTGETGGRLDNEIAARTAADAALGARIDVEHSLITQETADRIAAVQAEASARAALAVTVQEEASARAALAARLVGNNVLINGDFDFWQRGTQFAGSNVYIADRWFAQQGNVSGQMFRQHTPMPGESNFPDSPYTLQVDIAGNTGTASCYQVVEQRVEDVRTFAGKVSTLSFRVFNAGAAGRKIAVEFVQTFGSGGSSPVQGISAETFTLAAGMNYIKKTVTMPPVIGKAANFGHAAVVALWSSAGSEFAIRTGGLTPQTGTLYFSQIKWEPGAVATPFERRPIALELALAQRYYEKSYPLSTVPGSTATAGRVASGIQGTGATFNVTNTHYRVSKRATPAVTVYAVSTGAAGQVSQSNEATVAASIANISQDRFEIAWTPTAGNFGGWWHWVADAEI